MKYKEIIKHYDNNPQVGTAMPSYLFSILSTMASNLESIWASCSLEFKDLDLRLAYSSRALAEMDGRRIFRSYHERMKVTLCVGEGHFYQGVCEHNQ